MPFKNPEARRLYQNEYNHRPEVQLHHRLYCRTRYHRPDVKERQRLYEQRPEVKERIRPYRMAYLQRPKVKKHISAHKRLYRQTPKGRLSLKRQHARDRLRGFIPLCPNIWNCPVDYHHVSPYHPYVVPLPRKIHRAVLGKFHYAFNASVICFFYGIPQEVRKW